MVGDLASKLARPLRPAVAADYNLTESGRAWYACAAGVIRAATDNPNGTTTMLSSRTVVAATCLASYSRRPLGTDISPRQPAAIDSSTTLPAQRTPGRRRPSTPTTADSRPAMTSWSMAGELDHQLKMSYRHDVPEYNRRYVHFRTAMDEWDTVAQRRRRAGQMTQWLQDVDRILDARVGTTSCRRCRS